MAIKNREFYNLFYLFYSRVRGTRDYRYRDDGFQKHDGNSRVQNQNKQYVQTNVGMYIYLFKRCLYDVVER